MDVLTLRLSLTEGGNPLAILSDTLSGHEHMSREFDVADPIAHDELSELIGACRDQGLAVESTPEYDEWADLAND